MIAQCIQFLQLLRFPATGIKLRLTCEAFVTPLAVRQLLPIIPLVRGLSGEPYSTISVGSTYRSFQFVFQANNSHHEWGKPYSLELDLSWTNSGGWATDLIRALCDVVSVEHLVDVTLKGTSIERVDWLIIFGEATRIKHISVQSDAGLRICEALPLRTLDWKQWANTDSEPADGDVGRFLLPQLESMYLSNVDFTTFYPREQLQLHDLLPYWLVARKAGGIPLKKLTMEGCSCRQSWWPKFESIGVDVKMVLADEWFSDEDSEEE
ncbi:hypothetical protein BV25DRAFT_1666517 [Artomyces pyxidatus]|uniref:Uncharacterized protein n=1 Tax=Artomyces pyxidatus TaxID=48021 RepID=A0ACB8SJA2_9AGAM|nr:hypothetical protein BV25DRAFT_1666517 [Artomyces pyxidatus]